MKKFFAPILVVFIFLAACSSSNDDNPDSTTDDDGSTQVDKSQNLLGTGASANDLLSNANFDKILVEIAYVTGYRPTAEAMDNFMTFLQEHTFKQEIELDYKELPSPDEETLTLDEIVDLEMENRTAYNDGSTLAIYIYFTDAPSDTDDEEEGLVTLGAVYLNTSMVIFERTIQSLAGRSLSITDADVETATLNHEFGHLFGLVNLGTVAVNDHEDSTSANHCNVEGCLMRAELQFGSTSARGLVSAQNEGYTCALSGNSVMRLLESNLALLKDDIVPDLDAECILDLQSNGGR